MTTVLGVLAVANAVLTMFGASMYLGTMIVVQRFMAPAWVSLTLADVDAYFNGPISAATRFFRFLFLPLALSGVLLVWSGWGKPAAVVCAAVAFLSYASLALWFQLRMSPVNTRIMTAASTLSDPTELATLVQQWRARNRFRVGASGVYWAASVGFLLSLGPAWEVLS